MIDSLISDIRLLYEKSTPMRLFSCEYRDSCSEVATFRMPLGEYS